MSKLGRALSFDSFESWHHVTCRSHSITQCTGVFDEAFHASFFGLELGAFGIGETATPTAGVIRSQRELRDIRKDYVDDYMVLVVLAGRLSFEQNGLASDVTSGGMLLYDQARPFTFEFVSPHRLAAFSVSRSVFTQAISQPNRPKTGAVDSASPIRSFAATTLEQFLEISRSLDADTAAKLAPSVLDIVAAAFTTPDLARSTRREDLLLGAAKAFVERHFGEALSVVSLAAGLGVSPRTLARAFAAEGTTPMRWMWRARLAASYEGLRDGRFVSVTEAAARCGFTDLSHFSRAFKAAFGRTPLAVLRGTDDDARGLDPEPSGSPDQNPGESG